MTDQDLATRRAAWVAKTDRPERGYTRLYIEHVQQADKGVDFDFLVGGSGDYVPKRSF